MAQAVVPTGLGEGANGWALWGGGVEGFWGNSRQTDGHLDEGAEEITPCGGGEDKWGGVTREE